MTAPGGGNDEVIRVVYQAVADYSQLLRETRRAREQTAALKRDIDGLAGTTTAKIRVQADTSQARTDLANLVRDAVIRARVVLDAVAARSELAALVRDLVVRARVVVDAAAAKAEIRSATRDAEVRVGVRTDTAGLARLAADLAKIRDLIVTVSVRADTAALASLRAQLARLRDLSVTVAAKVDTAALAALRADLAAIRDLAVRIGVDVDDGALTALRARLSALRDRTINVAVRVDALALARLGSLLAGLDDAAGGGRTVDLDITFDFAGIEAKFRALLAHLESLGPVRLNVEIDRSVFDRIAELERAIAALRNSGGGGDGGAAGAGISGLLGSLNPAGLAAIAGKIALIAAAAALAVPVVAGLIALIGGLAAAALAAGGGLAIFGVAAVGAVANVTEAVKAFSASGTISLGPLGEVVRRVQELKAAYKDFQAATNGPVLAIFDRALQIALDLLDRVEPLVGTVAGAVEGAMERVQQALNGPGFGQFLGFVSQEAPDAIDGLTAGLVGFASGIGSLIMAFQPLIHTIVGGFADAGQAFAAWASTLDTNQSFQDFLAYATAQLPKLIDLIGSLITAGTNIAVGLAPAGSSLLDIANAGAEVLASIPPEFWEGFSSAVVDAAPKVEKLADALIGLVGIVDDIDTGFGALLDSLSAFLYALENTLRVVATGNPVLRGLANIIGKAADATAAAPDTTAAAQADAAAAAKAKAAAATAAKEKAAAATAAKAAAATASGVSPVAQGLQADFASDAGVKRYNDAVSAMEAYEAQQKAVTDATDAAAAADRAAKNAQEALTDARLAAIQRIKDVQRALRDMTLDERQAKLSAKESDESLAKVIANGGSADEIEQAKIDNERAHNTLNDLEQDKGPKKTALEKELKAGVDGNKALLAAIQANKDAQKALKDANTNIGKAAAKLTELHLAFQTAAGALGLTEGQLKKLKGNIDTIKGKTVKVTVNTKDAEKALAGLLQRQYALQLMARPPFPTFEQAMKLAADSMPNAAASGPGTKLDSGNLNPNVNRAEGGPLTPSNTTAGPVYGPGTGTSDSIAVRLPVGGAAALSRGEHIVTDAEVQAAPGGHSYLEAFRQGLRARRPWAPPAGFAGGGPARPAARVWSAALPAFRVPVLPGALPGYAGGGAMLAARSGDTRVDRSVNVHVGTITNAVPETAGASLYRQVRKALDGDY